MTEHLIMLVGIIVVGLWWFIAWQLSKEEAELPLLGPEDDSPEWKRQQRERLVAEFRQQIKRSGR